MTNKQTVQMQVPDGMTTEQFTKVLQSLVDKTNRPQKKEGTPVVYHEWESGFNKLKRVHKSYYKGKELLLIQSFYIDEKIGPDWQPGKGLSFSYEDIDEILTGLQTMKEALESEGYTPKEKEDAPTDS